MNDAMAIELAEQPEVWARLWARRGELVEEVGPLLGGLRRVVFAGCGDCHAAAEYGEALLQLRSGMETYAFPAMELTRARTYLLNEQTLLVAMSVSGRTPRVVEAARAARRRGARVLGLTDAPESPLTESASGTFVLGTAPPESLETTDYRDPEAARYRGYQRAVPQTKTFGAMQLAAAMVGLELERRRPSGRGSDRATVERTFASLPDLADAAAQAGRRAAASLARRAPREVRMTFCGTGLARGVARFAAYKLLELACGAAHGEVEEFCHTHYLVTGPGDAVAFFAQDERILARVAEIAPVVAGEIGASVAVLAGGHLRGGAVSGAFLLPAVPPETFPLLSGLAAGHLTRDLARAWGRNTDRFRAGREEERYVRGSTRMIRESAVLDL
ncbi:MAG: hypothetical protein Kow0092_21760 [Deferrisomatales bacterium]